jgi:hypothetical protein
MAVAESTDVKLAKDGLTDIADERVHAGEFLRFWEELAPLRSSSTRKVIAKWKSS